VPRQRKVSNGTVYANVRLSASTWFRTQDSTGKGPLRKLTVKR
jgi:hypothetical protein